MSALTDVIRREIRRIGSRPAYLTGSVLIPLAVAVFFVTLLGSGLPQRIPNGVVDLDHSAMSRQITRTLQSNQLIDITVDAESYDDALDAVRRGQIYGFFLIPANFENDAIAGRQPALSYYSNMTYFVPGTLTFKGFTTVAVTTAGGVVQSTLISLGATPDMTAALIQPVIIDINPLNNPWMNYSIYMTPSFSMATFVLMIMVMTVFSITGEIKQGTSLQWMRAARGHMGRALLGKMLPHTAIYMAVGLAILWMYFGWQHFPCNGPLGWMLLATFLVIVASQALALAVCCVLPAPRFSFIVVCLFGVLCYSFTGFSMPVPSMYGAIGIFSWLAPIRYWYLVFIENCLNGYPIYYCRWYFVGLLCFLVLPLAGVRRLKKAMLNPVYVP